MKVKRSSWPLWCGLGLLILGTAGVSLSSTGSRKMTPLSGWETEGTYDKGSYESNGERIYYLGIGSDGQRIHFQGGPHWLSMMDGSCVDCHGLEGKGGFPVMMGKHISGDIRYSTLVTGKEYGEDGGVEGKKEVYIDESIKRAIREGIKPSGKSMDRTMPRWDMLKKDMDDLVEYLKELG